MRPGHRYVVAGDKRCGAILDNGQRCGGEHRDHPQRGRLSSLNTEQVRAIRELHAQGVLPSMLAVRYHTGKRTIHRALQPEYIPFDAQE